jgi:hypothetical protein
LDAFLLAAKADLASAKEWLSRLEQITDDAVLGIFAGFPADQITEIAAEFAVRLLRINRDRLLHAGQQL